MVTKIKALLLAFFLMILMSNQALAGVKGSIGYEKGKSTIEQTIPYQVCTPVCQTTNSTSSFDLDYSKLRLNVGYEQQISGPIAIDLMVGTTPSLFDLRVESNLIFNVNDNLKIKTGVNRYQEKSSMGFNFEPGYGFQAGIEHKLPIKGVVSSFVDVKYYRMNQSYTIDGFNSQNQKQTNAVSIGIGLSF